MKIRPIFTTFFLILSLTALSGFSSMLHSHDLDLNDNHENCFSCEWNHVSSDHDSAQPGLEFHSWEQAFSLKAHNPRHLIFSSPFLGRAPPSNG